MYRAITPELMERLAHGRTTYRYSPGRTLFYQGHLPVGLWLLLQGALVFEDDGAMRGYVAAPAVVGLQQYLRHTPYPCTARSVEDSIVVHLGRSERAQVEAALST